MSTTTERFGAPELRDLKRGSTYAIVSPPDAACPGREAAREARGL